ncbi:MAG: hypothetical protein OQJ95_09865 [Kangiella sp.]|nr:hypothetical protein [Kangiella sp.]
MSSERRREETRGLRQLFQEQWQHFINILERSGVEPSARQLDTQIDAGEVLASIETMIEGTDRRIRALGNYKKRLRETVAWMLEYIDKAVTCLPEATLIDKNSFSSNPEVNAVFVNYEDIKFIFSHSIELQKFFSEVENTSCDEVYAVLLTNKNEKNILGKIIDNDMLVSDVKQVSVNFSAHNIVAPSKDEETLRSKLKTYAFNEIITYVSAHMTQLRHEQCEGKQNLTAEESINSVCNPQVYIDKLISMLNIPNTMLVCEKTPLRLNKMGIVADENSTETLNEFIAHEFKIGSQPARVVSLVRYPKSEMDQKIELL